MVTHRHTNINLVFLKQQTTHRQDNSTQDNLDPFSKKLNQMSILFIMFTYLSRISRLFKTLKNISRL